MDKKKDKILALLVGIIVILVFMVSLQNNTGRLPVKWQTSSLKGQWEKAVYQENGEPEYEYVTIIPEGGNETQILSVKVFWCSIDVFVDGKMIYSYHDDDYEKGVNTQWIELPRDSSGKKLAIRTSMNGKSAEKVFNEECYIGSRNEVFVRFLLENVYALIIGSLSFVIGIIMFLAILVFGHRQEGLNLKAFRYLGIFMMVSGGWILADSSVLQLFTGRSAAIVIASFVLFMLIPFLFLRYLNEMMTLKRRSIDRICRMMLLNIAVCLVLHILHIVPLFRSLVVHHILIICTLVMMVKYGCSEIKKYQNQEMRAIRNGMFAMIAIDILALIAFYICPLPLYAALYGTGILVFDIFLVIAAFNKIYFHLKRSASSETYWELAYKDVMTDMANRAAFVEEEQRLEDSQNLAYIMLDINNLKYVNDTYGHRAGDRLIIQAAGCILKTFEGDGKSFRIGGDEFLVIMEDTAEEYIDRKLEVLEQQVLMVNRSQNMQLEIAYGYALRQDGNLSLGQLLAKADKNMYAKKSQMKNKK